jgi:ribosomal protein S18 acetylase RimI-like enzyme
MEYTVDRCHNRAHLRHLMNQDAGESAYALGDLESPLWEQSDFWGAYNQHTLDAFVLFYRGFEIPTLTMGGHFNGIATILSHIALEPEVFCLAPAVFKSLILHHYNPKYLYDLYRMMVTPQHFHAPSDQLGPGEQLLRLAEDDSERLNALYAQAADPGEAIMAFSPSQIGLGVFYGVQTAAGELIAAAGTHVVSEHENIAAVGNIFTSPGQRGRGLGRLTTAAVTQALFEMPITRVVLNVKQTNAAAVRVYDQLGYRIHCEFIEGPAELLAH